MQIILASKSPRRAQLLTQVGLVFDVVPPEVHEPTYGGEDPRDYAISLARAKGRDISRANPAAVVISADTIVVVDGTVLGKPVDRDDARRMLSLLQGREHQVITGVCVCRGEPYIEAGHAEVTRVFFRPLSEAEIEAYVNTGEPSDKAGAYGIQGKGALLVARIDGCYSNVVGLPLSALGLMLKQVGIDLLGGFEHGGHLPNDT